VEAENAQPGGLVCILSVVLLVWVILIALVPLLWVGRVYWKDPRPTKGATPPVADALREQLGPTLAAWLGETRELMAEAKALHRYATEMLAEERARGDFPRTTGRRVDDANFLIRIREVRELGAAWRERTRELEPDFARLAQPPKVPWAELDAALQLPWGLTVDHDRKPDRSDEIEDIAVGTAVVRDALAAIDETMSAPGKAYR
jgi:hypothetical protein